MVTASLSKGRGAICRSFSAESFISAISVVRSRVPFTNSEMELKFGTDTLGSGISLLSTPVNARSEVPPSGNRTAICSAPQYASQVVGASLMLNVVCGHHEMHVLGQGIEGAAMRKASQTVQNGLAWLLERKSDFGRLENVARSHEQRISYEPSKSCKRMAYGRLSHPQSLCRGGDGSFFKQKKKGSDQPPIDGRIIDFFHGNFRQGPMESMLMLRYFPNVMQSRFGETDGQRVCDQSTEYPRSSS